MDVTVVRPDGACAQQEEQPRPHTGHHQTDAQVRLHHREVQRQQQPRGHEGPEAAQPCQRSAGVSTPPLHALVGHQQDAPLGQQHLNGRCHLRPQQKAHAAQEAEGVSERPRLEARDVAVEAPDRLEDGRHDPHEEGCEEKQCGGVHGGIMVCEFRTSPRK